MSGITRSRERFEIKCKHCDTLFTVPKNRKDTALYCSRKCQSLHSRVQVEANCEICGNHFTHISSRSNKAKYCSKTCYYKAMTKRGKTQYKCTHCGIDFLGSKSHNRKYCSTACNNKAKIDKWNPSFSTVRKQMMARDMIQKCERCGFDEVKEILGVHHKDRNRKNNALENLEVLCPNCHFIEHNKHTPHGFIE